VLAFLDDDATFASNGVVSELRERFSRDRRLAAVAMRIERPGGKILSHEFPFRGKGDPTRQGGPCAYFVGAGFAIRRTEYLAIGGFDARFFYSTEEIDLAFGLIRRGGILEYVPELVVVHSPSSRGRGHSGELPALRLRNRIWLARRHLPWLVAIVHISLWSARTLVEAIRAAAITGWLRALLIGLTTDEHRTPVTISTALRVHRLGGRSFW
jgi:GT2 family glycosyltransferase